MEDRQVLRNVITLFLLFVFLLEYVTEIPANISAEDLKTLLEDNFDVGKVNVTRVGSCAGFQWTVEWSSKGGDQPIISVDGTCLIGSGVFINVSVIDDGGLFLSPIPGDLLRLAASEPQVLASKQSPGTVMDLHMTFFLIYKLEKSNVHND